MTDSLQNVTIIDYGMGNLRSVANAFEIIGCHPVIAKDASDLREAGLIVLPGVGAFGDGMKHLESHGWIDALDREVRRGGKPFLGICLGMQLLATTGLEHGEQPGLGWIEGKALRLEPGDAALRIPHIGWNDVNFTGRGALFRDQAGMETYYFVHSYILDPIDKDVVTGICNYGRDFAASIEKDNIFAIQFHPEKSHHAGLALLKNVVRAAQLLDA